MIDIEDEETIGLIMTYAAMRGVDPDTAIRMAVGAALEHDDNAEAANGSNPKSWLPPSEPLLLKRDDFAKPHLHRLA